MKLNKFLIVLFAANGLLAQHKTTAKIETVTESGLHKIILPAEIRSFSKEELDDFRILDSKGIEIPYYIFPGNSDVQTSSFSECKILSNSRIAKSRTSIIFENPKSTLDEIVLSITNSDVTKFYSISGSNDQKEWFGLVNNSLLTGIENSNAASVLKTVKFPLTAYRFIKLDFNDKKTLPINVLKIGYLSPKTDNTIVEEIKPKDIKFKNIQDEKKTRILINFGRSQIINQIGFTIAAPNLFQRNSKIYIFRRHKIKQKSARFSETFFAFKLSSDQKNIFSIPQLFEKECIIEIENRDNQPLNISKVKFLQNQIAVIADLKANEKYTVTTGNSELNRPKYDLENFKNSMDDNLPKAKIYEIKHLDSQKAILKNESIWQQPWFMWLCIGFGGIIIAFFTRSLIKDMKKIT